MTSLAAPQGDPVQRLEFLCVQGAVLLAPYLSLRTPGFYFTASDMLFSLSFFLRLCSGRLVRPFGDLTWLWLAGATLLIGGLFIGSAVNGDLARGWIILGQYAFSLILVPLALLGRSVEQVVRLIKCAAWGMAIMCAVGVAVYLTGYRSDGTELKVVTGSGRLAGFVENPNGMAVLTVLAFPLIWLLLASHRMQKSVGFLLMTVLFVGLLMTASNTGLIGLVLATVIFFVGSRNFKALLFCGVLATSLLVWGQFVLPETFQERVLGAITSGNLEQAGTYAYRQELSREALAMAEDRIVVGIGADQYRVVSEFGHVVHNTHLLLLVEGGAMSLVGLLTIFAAALMTVLTSPVRPLGSSVTLVTFTITFVFAGLLNGTPHIYGRCWLLPLLIALSPAVAVMSQAPRLTDARALLRSRAGRLRSAAT